MGAWGYREQSSDDGLDRMAGSFLNWAKNNNNILDVDKCLKDSAARYTPDYCSAMLRKIEIKNDAFAMSEILHHFIQNDVLSELGWMDINNSYGWVNVTGVIASKEAIKYLAKTLSNYFKGDMSKFETSGWFDKEIYEKRCNWIKVIGQSLVKAANASNSDPIIIYDKATAKPEVYMYRYSIRMTPNHDLNRLRLFINYINDKRGHVNKNPFNKNKVYYEMAVKKDSQGHDFYALVFHNEEGKQRTIAKGYSPDEVIKNAITLNERYSLSEHDWYMWNLLYNRNMYTMYYKQLTKSKKQITIGIRHEGQLIMERR